MPKMIQIRNVPDSLHRKLKARAALAGMSLSEYLLQELKDCVARPTLEELLTRLPDYGDLVRPSPADVVREAREERKR